MLVSLLFCATAVAGHSVISAVRSDLSNAIANSADRVQAIGTSGPQGIGLGVDASNFRNCMDVVPCQQDSPIMRDAEVATNNFGMISPLTHEIKNENLILNRYMWSNTGRR